MWPLARQLPPPPAQALAGNKAKQAFRQRLLEAQDCPARAQLNILHTCGTGGTLPVPCPGAHRSSICQTTSGLCLCLSVSKPTDPRPLTSLGPAPSTTCPRLLPAASPQEFQTVTAMKTQEDQSEPLGRPN